MLWMEGTLLNKSGVWSGLHDLMFDRSAGIEYSSMNSAENRTPQDSDCSPLLFNLMINDVLNR